MIFLKERDKPLGTRVKIVLHLRRVQNIEENCKVANYQKSFINLIPLSVLVVKILGGGGGREELDEDGKYFFCNFLMFHNLRFFLYGKIKKSPYTAIW